MTDNPNEIFPDSNEIDVSVVIPVYNCEKYLHETIGSVRAQDMPPGSVEIIAVDDGSTDDSLKILDELAEASDDLHVYSIPNSGSAAAPRNVGLEHARGRYVFFLDADDKFSPNALSRLTEVADSTGSGVVLGKMGLFGKQRAGSVPTTAFRNTLFAVDFIESKANSTLGAWKLFRRSILMDNDVRFPLGYKIGEDQPFTMKAYLHSPHISILTDQVYYWLRGRDDGTNITATGQPPRKHLSRILTLIQTIVDNTEPGERRDHLLRRPIIGGAGVTAVFGKKLLPAHNRSEREEMLAEFSDVVTPLWNPRIRDHGTAESQVLVDLALRGDLDEVEEVSRILHEKKPLPISLDSDESQFVYVPQRGGKIGDLKVNLRAHLESIANKNTAITFTGELGVNGLSTPPESARLIFRHRKVGDEITHELDTARSYTRSFGTRVRFRTTFDVAALTDSSVWDIDVEATWGGIPVRQRFGQSRSKSLDISPMLIGNPLDAVVFFAKSEGLSVDVGPTEEHANARDRGETHLVDSYRVGRSEVGILAGQVRDLVSAKICTKSGSHTKPVELIVHSPTSASVIMPYGITKKGGWTLTLADARGTTIDIQGSDR
ncbi:glycosyltransferase family 2 protein [Brevibacterium sp. CT2-23B]|uniref:glycosyltransferase family 2 protein n=1 Tax=Brevibacterium sp. CT2-23B TaxID=2729630 RepID=UPI00155267D8|nr:glycosyltransferase family 2 protein [Brevibacterium sp. CT2-23B]